jgi:hypothetical protein
MGVFPIRWVPLVVGNFTAASRIGTFLSILIALAFLQRWRRNRPEGGV